MRDSQSVPSLREAIIALQNHFSLPALAMTLACLTLLTSCSHLSKRDGAPRFYVDETRIPDAVPKPEPLAKYGNYKSYVVFGKRYHTLPSSRNFTQTGTASWYGTMFHDRKTSSGEPYDMLKMTAAHKTLPLPTYVEVTNLKNNKRIIVKVNDRGPFASNRIIDLSYVAAKKLGMIGHGTAHVRVTAIDPYRYAAASSTSSNRSQPSQQHQVAAASRSGKTSYLQVGAFQNQSNALRLKNRIHDLIEAPVYIHQKSQMNSLYYVTVGPFHDSTALAQTSARLKQIGITAKRTA